MTRRRWLAVLAGLFSLWAVPRSTPAQQVANLNETLRSVLKCRRPEEFDFVDLVTQKVDQGMLPVSLVLSMMKWARQRRPDIPFPYFQEGLKRRAAEIGVEI